MERVESRVIPRERVVMLRQAFDQRTEPNGICHAVIPVDVATDLLSGRTELVARGTQCLSFLMLSHAFGFVVHKEIIERCAGMSVHAKRTSHGRVSSHESPNPAVSAVPGVATGVSVAFATKSLLRRT